MHYNFYFEIAAIIILLIIVYDGQTKKHKYSADARIFEYLVLSQAAMSLLDILSCIGLAHPETVSRNMNILLCVLFFVAQSVTLFLLYLFILFYCMPKMDKHNYWLDLGILLFALNMFFSIGSVWGKYYFYFDDQNAYHQGGMANLGYYFYILNAIFAIVMVVRRRDKLLKKELPIAVTAAALVSFGSVYQMIFRGQLVIGISVAVALLLLYMSLESPNNYLDKLTGCANDFAFKSVIAARENKQEVYSVLILDIQKFRFLNTIYGHEAGDSILRSIGQFFQREFGGNHTYRVSSNGFALMLDGDMEAMHRYEDIVRRRFQQQWTIPDGRQIRLEYTIVVCEYPRYFKNHASLTELTKYLSHQIKGNFSDTVIYATDESSNKCIRKEEIEKALQLAIRKKKLEVHYQPIYDCEKKCVVSLEALARLRDDKLGQIPPDEFIPVAEETGLIIVLGEQVFQQVCSFIKNDLNYMRDSSLETIEVNLSPLQCMQRQAIERLEAMMNTYDIPPDMINFEVTESATADEPSVVQSAMDLLISNGATFSLDDYGTGYSNISYLIQFPFQRIKFDKELVWSYFKDHMAQTIMEKEFDLIHLINKDIVVEGIETLEQSNALYQKGIRLHQGYYYSKPLPREECLLYLKENCSTKHE